MNRNEFEECIYMLERLKEHLRSQLMLLDKPPPLPDPPKVLPSLELLTTDEVAELLNLKVDRVYSLARQNIIPHVRLGRQIRFSPEALQEFIATGGKALPKE